MTLLLTCACGHLVIGPAWSREAEDFAAYLKGEFESIFKGRSLPQCRGFPTITISTSITDPREYVRRSEYGSIGVPQLCGYMDVFEPYELVIMANATIGDDDPFNAISIDYSKKNKFWYAENGNIKHGDPSENGLVYYEALNFPPLLGVWMDYHRGEHRPITGIYPMPYDSYKTRTSGSDLILLGNILGPFLYTFSAFSVARKLISERKGRLREGKCGRSLYCNISIRYAYNGPL